MIRTKFECKNGNLRIREYEHAEYHEIIGGEHMFRGEHDKEAQKFIKDFLSMRRGRAEN